MKRHSHSRLENCSQATICLPLEMEPAIADHTSQTPCSTPINSPGYIDIPYSIVQDTVSWKIGVWSVADHLGTTLLSSSVVLCRCPVVLLASKYETTPMDDLSALWGVDITVSNLPWSLMTANCHQSVTRHWLIRWLFIESQLCVLVMERLLERCQLTQCSVIITGHHLPQVFALRLKSESCDFLEPMCRPISLWGPLRCSVTYTSIHVHCCLFI